MKTLRDTEEQLAALKPAKKQQLGEGRDNSSGGDAGSGSSDDEDDEEEEAEGGEGQAGAAWAPGDIKVRRIECVSGLDCSANVTAQLWPRETVSSLSHYHELFTCVHVCVGGACVVGACVRFPLWHPTAHCPLSFSLLLGTNMCLLMC